MTSQLIMVKYFQCHIYLKKTISKHLGTVGHLPLQGHSHQPK